MNQKKRNVIHDNFFLFKLEVHLGEGRGHCQHLTFAEDRKYFGI